MLLSWNNVVTLLGHPVTIQEIYTTPTHVPAMHCLQSPQAAEPTSNTFGQTLVPALLQMAEQ